MSNYTVKGFGGGSGVGVRDDAAWQAITLEPDKDLLKEIVLAYRETLIRRADQFETEIMCADCNEYFRWPHGTPKICPRCGTYNPEPRGEP